MVNGTTFHITDAFIKKHCFRWAKNVALITIVIAGVGYLTLPQAPDENDTTLLILLLPAVLPVTIYNSLHESWKEEQQWSITLLPKLLRYHGPRRSGGLSAGIEALGKAIGENIGDNSYQTDIRLDDICHIDVLSSEGKLVGIEYSTKSGYNHRIAYYENIRSILQHMLSGIGRDCRVQYFTRKLPLIWP